MTVFHGREHFIPLRKADLAGVLTSRAPEQERMGWLKFFGINSALFHHYFQVQLDQLKDLYAQFDPDLDTLPVATPGVAPVPELEQEMAFFEVLDRLLQQANFRQLTWDEVLDSQNRSSILGVRMRVDSSVFERIQVHVRGSAISTTRRANWWRLWEPKEHTTQVHQRMVLSFRLKEGQASHADLSHHGIHIKLFRRIPRNDVEMLMPGARILLTGFDLGMIGFPLFSGLVLVVGNAILAIFSAGVSVLAGLVSWSVALAMGGYGFRSFSAWQARRNQYNLKVNRHLYFQKLDSNLGALLRLLDEAEEQECRETWLAYYCLVRSAPAEGWSASELDNHCELLLNEISGCQIDFEVEDSLRKLMRLGIVMETGGKYRALPLDQAITALDKIWDDLFPGQAHNLNEGAIRLSRILSRPVITPGGPVVSRKS